ncbi:glycosyltransferase family 2 protein [Riemerella anatipestifer]|uniref:glycosyltransferase family 2 protein n=1 Tax=Riemerella anatipestifer TaxID=34085 RepID=UPI00129E4F8C|nr:glycosyltransferase family 2 protein [Riemerella anatipestifer]
MDESKVSVIIPFYSGKQWLIEALNSVVVQTFANIEVILVNDGSIENIDDIVEAFQQKISLKYYFIKNEGPAKARNYGISKSVGEYICFLDSDDVWHPEKIEKQYQSMKKGEYVWAVTDYEFFENGTNKNLGRNREIISGDVFELNLLRCFIATPTVMIRRSILINNPTIRFNETVKYGEDTLFWYLLLSKYPLYNVKEILTKVRVRGTNAASRSKVQLFSRAKIYEFFKKKKFIINGKKMGKFTKIAYKMSYYFYQLSRNNEMFSKILYIFPWILFRLLYDIEKKKLRK